MMLRKYLDDILIIYNKNYFFNFQGKGMAEVKNKC